METRRSARNEAPSQVFAYVQEQMQNSQNTWDYTREEEEGKKPLEPNWSNIICHAMPD